MDKQETKAKISTAQIVKIIIASVACFVGAFDIFNVIDISPFHGVATTVCLTVILWLLATEILKTRQSRTVKFFRKMLIAGAILELTVFQFPSYNMLFGDYTQKTMYFNEASVSATNPDSVSLNDNDTVTVTGKTSSVFHFSNINQTIGTIKVNLDYNDKTKRVKMTVDMADETNSGMRENIASNYIVKDSENSNYAACQFSGEVSELKLKFSCDNDYDSVTLKSVTFNETVPFDISTIRFFFLIFVVPLGYGIVSSVLLRKSYENNKKFCWTSVLALTVGAVVIAVSMIMAKIPDGEFKTRFELESGDQITQEIVDAFENGQVSLLEEPNQEILNLDNPYDWSQRNASNIYYKWDHVLFDGKYYSYYGIAPVLTLFLPYHMITDHYFATDMAILLFSCIGLVFLGLTYMAIVKRWFRKVPSGCILAGAVIIFAACGIWYNVGRSIFYEISISCGFMYLLIAAYCLISSNVLSDGKISLPRTAISSLCFGLAVLSRPTLAVYAICAALFYIFAFKKSAKIINKETGEISESKIRKILYVICAALPIGALAIVQMWYNYARFDSPLDFGIQYSLTINDFTASEFHIIFVIIGMFNYLFAAPQFMSEYPYIKTPFSRFDVNGYYFSDVGNTSGIIFLAFPVIGYIFGGKALKKLATRQEKIKYGLMIGLPCVIMPLVILFSIWESGYAIRYTADFSWQIIIGALAILFFLYRESRNNTKKKLFRIFMAISMIAAIIINAVQILNFSYEESEFPEVCRQLTDIIAFWR